MVIFIAERGTVNGQPHFVMYTEDGMTPWETEDREEALNKYESLLGKLPVLGIFENVTKAAWKCEPIKGNDGISPHIGDNGNWFIGGTDTGICTRIKLDDLPPEALERLNSMSKRIKALEKRLCKTDSEEKMRYGEKLY